MGDFGALHQLSSLHTVTVVMTAGLLSTGWVKRSCSSAHWLCLEPRTAQLTSFLLFPICVAASKTFDHNVGLKTTSKSTSNPLNPPPPWPHQCPKMAPLRITAWPLIQIIRTKWPYIRYIDLLKLLQLAPTFSEAKRTRDEARGSWEQLLIFHKAFHKTS